MIRALPLALLNTAETTAVAVIRLVLPKTHPYRVMREGLEERLRPIRHQVRASG